ncbi:peptidase S41 [Idiomarina sp. OT37-5b]|jgi:Tol biopolymer transport system component/C-terminal processing protease CtpA/Prc|uniref:S41 family peptidase n=1 Tax=Idiomarina sp. OT37-5b TaxID=2100422 RepID=UPI000CF98582|nr:S41 family peptidase [Idiomarina sp. OT37-5b]AVJ54862.1 peptidase S41 [Idiomarina sp. OT37-5b]
MKRLVTSLLVSAALGASASDGTSERPLIMQPELSPDGTQIAFSYQGDIWTMSTSGSNLTRLTIHEGYESSPKWSNDGSTIAFSSDRFGNDDVFVMPSQGGRPDRLTYHSAPDRILGFNNDNQVLFNTRRLYAEVEREWEVYSVAPTGEATESRFMDALGFDAVVSPDGKKIAFVRGTCRVAREDYRGPANRNIWIYDTETGEYEQLTDFDGNDFMPQWSGNNELYFISSRAGKYNVFKQKLGSKRAKQITNEREFGVEHFSIDQQANHLVYQAADSVKLIADGNSRTIDLSIATDFRFDPVTKKSTTNALDEYSVSPNGELISYVVRGDLFVKRNDKDDKRSVRLTTGAARDRDVTWLDDNTLLFVSDRDGQNDIFALTSADADEPNLFKSLKHSVTAVTRTDAQEREPVVSPDGNKIAYREGRGKLIVAEVTDGNSLTNPTTLLDGWATPSDVSWSPDSNWLAYAKSDLSFNSEVFIHAADNSLKPVNVSMHPKGDYNPVWSPDGSKLGFTSMRNNGDYDIWFAWLTESDWQRSNEEWKRDEFADKSADSKKDDETPATAEPQAEPMQIDLDGIYKRLVQVTRFAGNESGLAFDKEGEHVYYTIGGAGRQNFKMDQDLFKIKWNGEDKKHIIKDNKRPRSLSLSTDGKHLFALTGKGTLVKVDTKKDKPETLATVSQQSIEHMAERAQIFDEAWQALNAGFYDPEFHGNDWQQLKEKYRPLALKASTKEDFQYIFNLMLGQVNASHMGLYRGENQKETQKTQTGLLGIEVVPTAEGLQVTSVLNKSPAARDESRLQVNDIITHVNQRSVKDTNFYELLNDYAKQRVLLNIKRATDDVEVVLWPTTSLSDEKYDNWVETRRALTEEYSDGRLGYLHIRGMNWTSFERFERELMAAGYGKEGIVIDVRYNGGGWTTDYLMAVLNVKQHAYTIPRGATDNLDKDQKKFRNEYPYSERLPLSAWTKPSIAMSNENSYSNAEIFSHAYKSLGIGKLVGRPTFGAVISTGAERLVDGSIIRMPFRGWWVKESDANMDFTPAQPDIEVFNPPAYKAKKVDPQLERAVDELLKSL